MFFWAVAYLAVIYLRPGELVPALLEVPVLQYLSIAAAAAAVVSAIQNPRSFWSLPQDKFFLMFFGIAVLSNPLTGWLGGAQFTFVDFIPVAFCYVLIRLGVRTPRQVRWFILVFVLLNTFLAVNGLLQIYTGIGLGGAEALDTREGVRIQGTGIFNDPNDLGMTLVMAVPFVLTSFFARNRRTISKAMWLAVLVALLAACYYTNSRGTIVGLAVVLSARVYRRFGLLSATVLATVAVVGLFAFGPSRMSTVSPDDDSAQGRIKAWNEGYEMFKESPLFGVGYRQFGEHHERPAHNSFVHVLAELGLGGAVCFVGLFVAHIKWLRRIQASVEENAPVVLAIVDSTLGLFACICFLSRQYVAVTYLLVALAASLPALNVNEDGSAAEKPRLFNQLAPSVAVTMVLFVTFYVIARTFSTYG